MGLLDSFASAIPVIGPMYAGAQAEDMQREAGRAQRRQAQKAIAEQRAAYGDVANIYDPYMEQGQQSLQGYLGMQDPTLGQFQMQGGDLQSFMDPDLAMRQQAAQQAVQQAFGARGALNSSAALKAQQRNAAQIAADAYATAFDRQQGERQFQYEDWLNRFKSQADAAANRRAALGNVAQIGYGTAGSLANARMDTAGNIGQAYGAIGNANATSATAGMNSLQGGMAAGNQITGLLGAASGAGWFGSGAKGFADSANIYNASRSGANLGGGK